MVEPGSMQKNLNNLQKNEDTIASIFGKLVSGKAGYKAVIEKSKPQLRCSKCSFPLEGNEKFCQECGTKTDFLKN